MRLPLVLLLALLLAAPAADAAGPIVAERPADALLDSFEGEPPTYQATARDGAAYKISSRPGIARDGARSLLLEMAKAPEGKGRYTVTLRWPFTKAQEWSRYEGLSLWLQAHGSPPPRIVPILSEAGGAQYWSRETELLPRKEGQWQLVEIPFRRFTWSWEAGKDANGRLDLDQVVEIRFEIHARKDAAYSLGMDGLGLYNPRPPYAGPTLRLRAPDNNKGLYVRAPGEEYRLAAELRQLAPGRRAQVALAGTDYWGKPVFAQTLEFEGAGERVHREFTFANPGAGYVGITGTVLVEGKPVYLAEQGVGCLLPAAAEDTAPNEDSPFGIWVNSDRRIGQQWDRILIRLKGISKSADGRYQMEGCPTGVSMPSKWGWGDPALHRIAVFNDVPRWLSSQPERSDWQKWSPTDWEEFARLIEFMVAGAKESSIRRYEVWNEPVPYAYWMGPMESVVKLHEVTYQAIKRAQPEARVLGPCPYTFLWEFLDDFFRLGGGKWIDDVVVHAYDTQPPDVNLSKNLRRLREVMARNGLGDRDVYVTEMGYSTPQVTEQEQARYLVRSFVYALSERVRVLVWHMLWDWSGTLDPENYIGDAGFAIVRFERSPRPAYVAYAVMTRLLERAQYLGPVSGLSPTQRGFRFEKRGRRITVLWETGPTPSACALPEKAEKATLVDIMGGERTIHPTAGHYTLTLGPDVTYLVTE